MLEILTHDCSSKLTLRISHVVGINDRHVSCRCTSMFVSYLEKNVGHGVDWNWQRDLVLNKIRLFGHILFSVGSKQRCVMSDGQSLRAKSWYQSHLGPSQAPHVRFLLVFGGERGGGRE